MFILRLCGGIAGMLLISTNVFGKIVVSEYVVRFQIMLVPDLLVC